MKQQQRAGPGCPQIPAAVTRSYRPKYTEKQRIDCLDCLYFNRKERRCVPGEENCILLNGLHASDKPKDCRYCYWWNSVAESCRRDSIGGCAYELINDASDQTTTRPPVNPQADFCRTCPYSIDHSGQPCVSFCMKNLLEEWNAERRSRQM